MPRPFSIAYLTYAPLGAPEAIRLAGKLGYEAIGLRLAPAVPGGGYAPLIEQPALLRETQAALKGEGVIAFDIEILRLTQAFRLEDHRRYLEVCGELGAKALLVVADDAETARLEQNMAALCDAAAPFGLTADIEFMSWVSVRDAAAARRLAEASGRANAGVLVDALHVSRTGTTLADLEALPRGLCHYVQLCDADLPVNESEAETIRIARGARLLPGEGAIDLAGILNAMPGDIAISLECPNEARMAAHGVEDWARQTLAAARRVVAGSL